MKQYGLEFLKRGLMAASGGPVILAIVYKILGNVGVITSLTADEVCMGILTIALMAFIAAGISVVYSIERLPLICAILIHAAVLYADYILVYLLNGWLKSQLVPILIFTCIFVVIYALVWLCIYLTTKAKTDRINQKLHGGKL